MFLPQSRAQSGNRVLLEDRGTVDEQAGVRQIANTLFSQTVGGNRIAQVRGVEPAIDPQGAHLRLQVQGLLARRVVVGGDVPTLARQMPGDGPPDAAGSACDESRPG